MVTVTTDPDHDGPPAMLAYAKAQGANLPGWYFLSGKPANVRRVLALFGIAHEETEEDEMTHVLDLYLIAPDGTAVHHYTGLETSPDRIASESGRPWRSDKSRFAPAIANALSHREES